MTAINQNFTHRVRTSRRLTYPLVLPNARPFDPVIATAEFVLAKDVTAIESAILIHLSLGDGVAITPSNGVQVMVVTLTPESTDIAQGDYYYECRIGWGDDEIAVVATGNASFIPRLP